MKNINQIIENKYPNNRQLQYQQVKKIVSYTFLYFAVFIVFSVTTMLLGNKKYCYSV
jgi:Trk-type K+ transport system membrane component